jgi:hypothetical protein
MFFEMSKLASKSAKRRIPTNASRTTKSVHQSPSTKDTKVLIETPDQVFAEYVTHAAAAGTGRRIHHLFAGRLVAKGGQIKLLRESMNVLAAVQALNPKGATGLPPPPAEIFSVPSDYVS